MVVRLKTTEKGWSRPTPGREHLMTDFARMPCITSFERSIQQWPLLYKDLNDGGDTSSWAKLGTRVFAPALLENMFFTPTEEITFSFPAFIDDNPVVTSQTGVKVKWHGKARQGMLAFTGNSMTYIHEDYFSKDTNMQAGRIALSDVNELNPILFGFSLISMTSAGPGHEILLRGDDGPGRILFRLALSPREGDAAHTRLLRRHLHLV